MEMRNGTTEPASKPAWIKNNKGKAFDKRTIKEDAPSESSEATPASGSTAGSQSENIFGDL